VIHERKIANRDDCGEMELEEHAVIFLDFLGTRDAIAEPERASKLLSLLLQIAALRGEFAIENEEASATAHQFRVKPAISSFSDHMVMSFPIRQLSEQPGLFERTARLTVVSQMLHYVSAVAAMALAEGFLLRGGATLGQL
jgi:hypothetical protein